MDVLMTGEVELPLGEYEKYFKKLVSIWRERCSTINKRLAGTCFIDKDSAEYASACKAANALSLVAPEVWKVIPKSDLFSSSAYEVSSTTDPLSTNFSPCVLDKKRHPHIPFPYLLSLHIVSKSDFAVKCQLYVHAEVQYKDSWLCAVAFPNLLRLLQKMDISNSPIKTLSLVKADTFIETYRHIKQDYGHQIAANWKERTDPQKFVYEDCAIAAYLSEVWRNYKREDISFCDVGCGNGLLVFLLTKMKFVGYGVDLRRRKIWSDFKDADLRELALNPEEDVISDATFLIGNHNDELTCWIPVLAARNQCNFFLLPCCPYNFYGRYSLKKRTKNGYSIYTSYLSFLRNICSKLGFVVQEDRLKIPSTKRHCILCTVPPSGLPHDVEAIIRDMLNVAKLGPFVVREKAIQVQNCTHLPKDFQERLTHKIFYYLYSKSEEHLHIWHRGQPAALREVADLLDEKEKLMLKNSCGGLQTFIKNQHQIFKVNGGNVVIRDWITDCKPNVKNLKTRPCWFHLHHPQGCPLPAESCSFKH